MLTGTQIQEMSREAAVKAAKRNAKPLCIWKADLNALRQGESPRRMIPFLGDYIPFGYERVVDTDGTPKALFVDSSGFGTRGESAMTIDQFAEALQEGDYIGIVQAGEFQVYVGFYRKIPAKAKEAVA